jgi:hypothetical protein
MQVLFDGLMFQLYGEVLQKKILPSIFNFDFNQFLHLMCIFFITSLVVDVYYNVKF